MSKNSCDVNVIGLRIKHHAGASGYDQLISKINAHPIATKKELSFAQKVLVKILNRLIINSGFTWYHCHNFIAELTLIKRWLMGKRQVFHFLYRENSYRYAGLLKSLGKIIFLYPHIIRRLRGFRR